MFTKFAKCDLKLEILKKKAKRLSGGYVTEGYILRNGTCSTHNFNVDFYGQDERHPLKVEMYVVHGWKKRYESYYYCPRLRKRPISRSLVISGTGKPEKRAKKNPGITACSSAVRTLESRLQRSAVQIRPCFLLFIFSKRKSHYLIINHTLTGLWR